VSDAGPGLTHTTMHGDFDKVNLQLHPDMHAIPGVTAIIVKPRLLLLL
jgi:hypothetical protein